MESDSESECVVIESIDSPPEICSDLDLIVLDSPETSCQLKSKRYTIPW